MQVLFLTLGLIGFFFILMSVRLLFIKGGEFKGTCASQSPFLRNEVGNCNYCGKPVGACETEDSPLGESEVDKVIGKFK